MGEDLKVATNQLDTLTKTGAYKPAEQAVFLSWMLLTDKERIENNLPRTQKELAEFLNVATSTLSLWKQQGGFQGAFAEGIKTRIRIDLGEQIPKVNRALLKLATGKDTRAMEMVYKLLGCMPKEGPVVEVTQNQSITLEQALKDAGETFAPPTWAEAQVIDVPAENVPAEAAAKTESDLNQP